MNRKHFSSVELLTFAYGIITGVYILLFVRKIDQPAHLLLMRGLVFAVIVALMFVSERCPHTPVRLIRYVFPFALVAYWYPETYYLGHEVLMPNFDRLFDRIDAALFGCSPAMKFSAMLPQRIVSEIMYFGYLSYYFLFVFLFFTLFFIKPALADRTMFYCLCSFFIFYAIFALIPAAGPQFYYSYPDNAVPDGYFFSHFMRDLQTAGEKPTGAFPSSHVGMTLIAMYLIYRNLRKWFYVWLPIAMTLIASTVYIKAHYLIDVIAAFIVTPIIFLLSKKIYGAVNRWQKADVR
ncbi:MAG: phosphatase PAP2 family protein [Prevotella sp.]|nr:phosphatase PAP2 family protein [Prevotella sp.]